MFSFTAGDSKLNKLYAYLKGSRKIKQTKNPSVEYLHAFSNTNTLAYVQASCSYLKMQQDAIETLCQLI